MKIPVAGFDPSMTHWGIASGQLDLTTGYLEDLVLRLVEPEKFNHKQIRRNSEDLFVAEQLAKPALAAARSAKVIFVEVPVGSKSARAMAGYAMCIGILGVIRSEAIPLIEVTATEVKFAFTGNKNASKRQMIDQAIALYPTTDFPNERGRIVAKAEHVADAIAAIHAGVNTPMFQNLIRLYDER